MAVVRFNIIKVLFVSLVCLQGQSLALLHPLVKVTPHEKSKYVNKTWSDLTSPLQELYIRTVNPTIDDETFNELNDELQQSVKEYFIEFIMNFRKPPVRYAFPKSKELALPADCQIAIPHFTSLVNQNIKHVLITKDLYSVTLQSKKDQSQKSIELFIPRGAIYFPTMGAIFLPSGIIPAIREINTYLLLFPEADNRLRVIKPHVKAFITELMKALIIFDSDKINDTLVQFEAMDLEGLSDNKSLGYAFDYLVYGFESVADFLEVLISLYTNDPEKLAVFHELKSICAADINYFIKLKKELVVSTTESISSTSDQASKHEPTESKVEKKSN